jgi:hypothetical protein
VGESNRSVRVVAVLAMVLAGIGRGRPAGAGETERISASSRDASPAAGADLAESAPRLRLVWIDVLGSAPYAFQSAARETSAILADAGVQAAWTLGDASTVSTEDELKIVLMPGATNGARLPEHVMGGTRRGAQSHTTWLYLSNVLWALGLQDKHARRLSVQEEEQVARALGRVAAHEIVHAVAPDLRHSAHGLMAEKLGRAYLIRDTVTLAPAERSAFRAAAQGFDAAPNLAVSAAYTWRRSTDLTATQLLSGYYWYSWIGVNRADYHQGAPVAMKGFTAIPNRPDHRRTFNGLEFSLVKRPGLALRPGDRAGADVAGGHAGPYSSPSTR